MFPWRDPRATRYPMPPRSDTPAARARYARRAADMARERIEAQRAGRDYSRCLPCVNGDTDVDPDE